MDEEMEKLLLKQKIQTIGMILVGLGCFMLFIYVLVYTHNTINSLSSQEINGAYEKIRPLMIFVEISAWGILIGSIVGYERIQKVWKSKWLPLKMIIGSLLVGIFGVFIPI